MLSRIPREDSSKPPDQGEETQQILKIFGVGIDVHSRFIQICVLLKTQTKVVRFERTFTTQWVELVEAKQWAMAKIRTRYPEFKERDFAFTIESTGCYHLPVLHAFGGKPSVVNPLLANPSRRKTDKLDARLLAHHAITGLWPASYVVADAVQTARILLSQRTHSIRQRRRIANRIGGLVLRYGHTFTSFSRAMDPVARPVLDDLAAGASPKHPGVRPVPLPDTVRAYWDRMLHEYDRTNAQVKEDEKNLKAYLLQIEWITGTGELASGKKILDVLTTVPAIGCLTAIVWLVEIIELYHSRRSFSLSLR